MGKARDYAGAARLLESIIASGDGPYAEALLYLGRCYHKLGFFGPAILAFKRYLALRPGSAEGLFFLGRAYFAVGERELSFRNLYRAQAMSPKSAKISAFLGLALLKARRPAKAMEVLSKAVELSPGEPRLYRAYLVASLIRSISLNRRGEHGLAADIAEFVIRNGLDVPLARAQLALAERELGRASDALAGFTALNEISPGDPWIEGQIACLLLEAGRRDEAAPFLNSLVGKGIISPDQAMDPRSVGIGLVYASFAAGEWAKARERGLALLRAGSNSPLIRAIVAESCAMLGRYDDAAAHYDRAIEASPADRELRLGKMMTLWAQGEADKIRAALPRFSRDFPEEGRYYSLLLSAKSDHEPGSLLSSLQAALHAKPGDSELMFALGAELLDAGLPDLAMPWFEKLVALDPSRMMASRGLIRCAELLGDKKGLVRWAQAYLERDPDGNDVRKLLLDTLMAQGDYALASAHLEAFVARGLGGNGLKRALASCYKRLFRYGEAAVVYRDLLGESPHDAELLKSLIFCLSGSGNPIKARKLCEAGIAKFPKDHELRVMLGVIEFREGNPEAAVARFREALELVPGDPRTLRNLAKAYKAMGMHDMAARYAAMSSETG